MNIIDKMLCSVQYAILIIEIRNHNMTNIFVERLNMCIMDDTISAVYNICFTRHKLS